MIDEFFIKIEKSWKPTGLEPFLMRIIGSAALFLQTDYVRGTKDADVLEINELPREVWNQLKIVAGKGSKLAKAQRLYIDPVAPGLPFLPPTPLFHPLNDLNRKLKHFRLEALDPLDVILSKLKTFRPGDLDDIRAMVSRDLVNSSRLVERFELAKEHWLLGSRATELGKCIENLHIVERDYLFVPETLIELPDWWNN